MRSLTRLEGWLLLIGLVGLIFASNRNQQVAASLPPASTPQDSWFLLVDVTRQTEGRLVEEGQILSSVWARTRDSADQQLRAVFQIGQVWRQKLTISARARTVTAAEPQAKAQPGVSAKNPAGAMHDNLPLLWRAEISSTPLPSPAQSRVSPNPTKPGRQPELAARRTEPLVPDSQPVERLRIPALHVNVPVVSVPFDQISWDLDNVQQEVAQLGSLTGEQSTRNLVLAGHVTLRNMSHGPFRYLHWLKPGDLLTIETSHTIQTYRLREQIIVKPEDVSVTENTSEQQLTLITCTDWSEELKLYQRRRVVLADLVSIEPKQEKRQ